MLISPNLYIVSHSNTPQYKMFAFSAVAASRLRCDMHSRLGVFDDALLTLTRTNVAESLNLAPCTATHYSHVERILMCVPGAGSRYPQPDAIGSAVMLVCSTRSFVASPSLWPQPADALT